MSIELIDHYFSFNFYRFLPRKLEMGLTSLHCWMIPVDGEEDNNRLPHCRTRYSVKRKTDRYDVKWTMSRWQNLKKSGWLFQVGILSFWWYDNDRTFFQLHYTGIVIFIKTGPVFVGNFRCCKMCFWNLQFLKRG